jgi:hypothetical protein
MTHCHRRRICQLPASSTDCCCTTQCHRPRLHLLPAGQPPRPRLHLLLACQPLQPRLHLSPSGQLPLWPATSSHSTKASASNVIQFDRDFSQQHHQVWHHCCKLTSRTFNKATTKRCLKTTLNCPPSFANFTSFSHQLFPSRWPTIGSPHSRGPVTCHRLVIAHLAATTITLQVQLSPDLRDKPNNLNLLNATNHPA